MLWFFFWARKPLEKINMKSRRNEGKCHKNSHLEHLVTVRHAHPKELTAATSPPPPPFPNPALVWEPACHPIYALMLWHKKRQNSKQSRSNKWGQFSEISETWQDAHWVDYINKSPVHMSHSRKYFLHKNSKTAPSAIIFDREGDIIMENWPMLIYW